MSSEIDTIADVESRKERATGGVFAAGFHLSDALDIAADVYHGVRVSVFVSIGRAC